MHYKGPETTSIKILIIGDSGIGKTVLYLRYIKGTYVEDCIPSVLDNHKIFINSNLELQLWDTAGDPSFDRLRPLSYPGTSVFVLCFDVASKASFGNIERWHSELNQHCLKVPVILVATKIDLRKVISNCVSLKDGGSLAKKLKCKYVETSSSTGEGVEELFDLSRRIGLEYELSMKSNKVRNPVSLSVPTYRKQHLTVVALGYDFAGKTTMLTVYYTGVLPMFHISIFDNVVISDEQYGNVELLDTCGNENYEGLRPLSYANANVFILCFPVNNTLQFSQLEPYWFYEIKHFRPDVPIILTATKIDLRETEETCVTTEEGEALAAKTGSYYAELSSLEKIGLDELFKKAKELGHKHNLSLKGKRSCLPS